MQAITDLQRTDRDSHPSSKVDAYLYDLTEWTYLRSTRPYQRQGQPFCF